MIFMSGDAALVGLFVITWILWSILVCIPITAKRLHDHNLSGAFIWLMLIPYINGFVAIWFLIQLGCIPGKALANRYGPPLSQIRYRFGNAKGK